jgi:hypothetical protein
MITVTAYQHFLRVRACDVCAQAVMRCEALRFWHEVVYVIDSY